MSFSSVQELALLDPRTTSYDRPSESTSHRLINSYDIKEKQESLYKE